MNVAMRIANHCSPALAGIKPANLFSYSSAGCCSVDTYIVSLAKHLRSAGIFFRFFETEHSHKLCLVYREKILLRHLAQKEICDELIGMGYPVGNLEAMLDFLGERLNGGVFPHEIAYFLGYPVEDIKSFLQNRGKNYCFNGYWKVYNNPQRAEVVFKRYTLCKEAVLRRINNGTTLEELFS